MVAATAPSPVRNLLLSNSGSLSNFQAFRLCALDPRGLLTCSAKGAARRRNAGDVRCAAVGTAAVAETKKKSVYEITTLTTWLLQQEKAGVIDAEMTIVLSSISMACKQIASLVQRAGISNLTGVQGAVNIQGEDQKKLDVVSNEVINSSLVLILSIFLSISTIWGILVPDQGYSCLL